MLFAVPAKSGVDDPAGKRLALVVGNSDYQSAAILKNAVNDSDAIAEKLKGLGFEVTSIENAGQKTFRKAVDDFSAKAKGATATVFYFSGHGFQLNGANYLVPTDAKLKSAAAIEKETLRLDSIIAELQGRDRQTLIFLDACRNNPLPESMRDKNGAEGLAQIETGSGTFVAFATQPGNITRDGAGENSPFTLGLLEHMDTPGISISDMMIRVRNSVEKETLQTQTPWDQSSLRSQFYFVPEGEGDDALTDEDRELLMSLDPELRKKFEVRFGLQIESVDEATDGSGETVAAEPLIAHIQPAVSIEAASDATEAPASDTQTVAAADKPAPKPAEPEPVAIVPGLLIASGDDEAAPASPPAADQVVAETAPIPTARPEAPVEKEVDMAMLDAAVATPRPLAPVEMKAPAAEVPIEVAPQAPLSAAPAQPARSKSEAAVPAPVAPATQQVSRLAPIATIKPAAPVQDASRAISAEPDVDLGLKPLVGQRIVGQEVEPEAPVAPVEDAVAVPQPEPAVPTAEEAAPEAVASEAAVPDPSLPTLVPAPGAAQPDPSLPTLIPAPKEVASVPAPEPVSPPVAAEIVPEQQMASLSPDEIKPDLVKPLPESPVEAAVQDPLLPRAIQEQLARLGCYRSGIDGDWGAGSAKALLRYYATKKEAPDDLDPSETLLAKLTNEETVVCTRTESDKPKVKKPAARPAKEVVKVDSPKGSKAPAAGRKQSSAAKVVTTEKLKKKMKMGAFR